MAEIIKGELRRASWCSELWQLQVGLDNLAPSFIEGVSSMERVLVCVCVCVIQKIKVNLLLMGLKNSSKFNRFN